MQPTDQGSDFAEILKALGQLALAASQAEAYAAQGLYYLLTDSPGSEEGAARIATEFRSFDSLYRLLTIALRCDTPLVEVLDTARADAEKRDSRGDPQLVATLAGVASSVCCSDYLVKFASQNRRATALEYLNKVKALHDKRNECIHALGIDVAGHEAHLYKRKKDGTKAVLNAQHLMEPCIELPHYPGITLARAIEAVSLELSVASVPLTLLPVTIQWFRRRGTHLDYAALVDHYVALSVRPLDEQLELLSEIETTLRAKLDAYHASKQATPGANGAES